MIIVTFSSHHFEVSGAKTLRVQAILGKHKEQFRQP